MELFDTHAHLDFSRYSGDREEVIKRAAEAGVVHILNAGADLASSRRGLGLARDYEGITASVGVHPHEASSYDLDAARQLRDMAEGENAAAIGETGLDYHYDNSPRPDQRQAFRSQLRLARELEMPVIIHSREAESDTIDILSAEYEPSQGAVVHCYSSGAGMARELVEEGLCLGFTGLLTFGGLDWLRDIAAEVPLEQTLIETDSPYMSPEPERGGRNEPARVKHVADQLAEIHGIETERAAEITVENGRELFGLAAEDNLKSLTG
ncbi:TatD family hydrolase [Halarsenatibacter silvermanii]|uniref:TatD DNase family protein n=1 Tax=Halarsenatibacter silvermanii TaxID=321763 RepID=A0A1G9GZ66_9FIRM|nr:TatD family hydrolase [Halarsenatibacter silvermanii]SDL05956.1 TatD DNase family protein [Halarsenatibacter silvermanii]